MNKVVLVGNLTNDVEKSVSKSGVYICKFCVAVNRPYAGDDEQPADFFRVTTFGNCAKACGNYLKKGNKVAISGIIQVNQWLDKDGQRRYSTEIVASNVEFLTPKGTGQGAKETDKGGKGTGKAVERSDKGNLPW